MDEWKDLTFEEYKIKLESINPNLAVESDDYNLRGAWEGGLVPSAEGHLGSRNPYTGEILKRPGHRTFEQAIETDIALGYKIYSKDGVFYSIAPEEVDRVKNIKKEDGPTVINSSSSPFQAREDHYMNDVAEYIQSNPFDSESYVKSRFDNPKSRIEYIKRTMPESYTEELQQEADKIHDIQLAPVYKKAMLKEYENTSGDLQFDIAIDFMQKFDMDIETFKKDKESILKKDYDAIHKLITTK